mmetsp:Transcript_3696/g.6293  ORF Transcript_3696/g.6293 Transcript_3696/m.6293 type:complete len:322 (+) Transcript_3696:917-1882(+)
MKKPSSNVDIVDPNLQPCSAYVNYGSEEDAKAAIEGLNGKCVLTGSRPLRIEFYQRANRFLGGFQGLDRKQLIENTHFRVLFIRGLSRTLGREELRREAADFGNIESLTIKTKIQDGQIVSKGIAILQYSSAQEATQAIKGLPFRKNLGEVLDIDFYQSRESRTKIQEIQKASKIEKFFMQQAATINAIGTLINETKPSKNTPKPNGRGRKTRGRKMKAGGAPASKRSTSASHHSKRSSNRDLSTKRTSRSHDKESRQSDELNSQAKGGEMVYRVKNSKDDEGAKQSSHSQSQVKYVKKEQRNAQSKQQESRQPALSNQRV